MEPERDEVYERIPWETLEKKGGDRQWMAYAIAGAVVLGALGYSFTRNQPIAPPATDGVVVTTVPAAAAEGTVAPTPSTVPSPIVMAEADLYAVDPERLFDRASSHAEWFAVEYLSADGAATSRDVLTSLLPAGAPLPEAPETTQVYVDFAATTQVTQSGPTSFDVDVLVRSLVSSGDSGFVRQPPRVVTVAVTITEDGLPRVAGVPSIEVATTAPQTELSLQTVPDDLAASAAAHGEVLGGIPHEDGTWEVVVMGEGPDGVRLPMTLRP